MPSDLHLRHHIGERQYPRPTTLREGGLEQLTLQESRERLITVLYLGGNRKSRAVFALVASRSSTKLSSRSSATNSPTTVTKALVALPGTARAPGTDCRLDVEPFNGTARTASRSSSAFLNVTTRRSRCHSPARDRPRVIGVPVKQCTTVRSVRLRSSKVRRGRRSVAAWMTRARSTRAPARSGSRRLGAGRRAVSARRSNRGHIRLFHQFRVALRLTLGPDRCLEGVVGCSPTVA